MSRAPAKRFVTLSGEIKPLKFIAFDIETYTAGPKKGHFMFGGIYDGQEYICFTDRERMLKFMTNEAFSGCIFIAHNAEYDLNRIFLYHEQLERFYLGSKLIFAQWKLKNGFRKDRVQRYRYIKYWDSFNFSFCSLAKLGRIIGIEKIEIEHGNQIDPEYIEYNRRDCEIVYKFVTQFQDKINRLGGQVRTSLAGCSMDLFRRFFMPEDAQYWRLLGDVKENFRAAYYGGRTEVFHLGEHSNVNYYDINSSYPSAMLGEFPLLDSWQNGIDLEKEGCSLCDITVPTDTRYPVLPLRSDKIIFPVGNWRGWYFNNEIRYARTQGVKVHPIRGIHYTESDSIFKGFIDHMYVERQATTNKVDNFIFKTLMNSLYGRFAMKNHLEKFTGRTREVIESDAVAANVIWAGMITARGRIALHKLLKRTDSIYCDTDSSMTTKRLRKTSPALGDISLEKSFKTFKANNPKDYEWDSGNGKRERKIKGVPARAIETSRNHFIYEIPVKFKTSRNRNIDIRKWISIDKHVSECYDKRVVLKDGSTIPHEVEYDGWRAGQKRQAQNEKRRNSNAAQRKNRSNAASTRRAKPGRRAS